MTDLMRQGLPRGVSIWHVLGRIRDALRIDQGQIVALQLLRGCAASAVVLEHLFQRYARRGALTGDLPEYFSRLGQTGVFAFFAISGFIMVFITHRPGDTRPRGREFLRARYLRVAPLYYLTTLIMVAFAWGTHAMSTKESFRFPTMGEWIASFLFIPHRGANGVIQPVYELGWSLHYEMFFYLLFAAGLVVHRRYGVALVIGVLAVLSAVGTWIPAPSDRWGLRVIAYVFTQPVMLFFVAGMLLALVRNRLKDCLPTAPLAFIASVSLGWLAVALYVPTFYPTLLAVTLGVACAVLIMPRASTSKGMFAIFSSAMGNASYSIYLTHSFLLGAFALITSRFAGMGYGWLTIMALLACAMCCIVGWLTWHFVEVPMTRWLRGRRSRLSESVAP